MVSLASLKLPTEVIFGSGCAETVGMQARRLGAQRVLLISDRGLEKAGLVEQLGSWLRKAALSVESYTGVEAEPPISSVEPCLDYARQADCQLIVGLGGGSVMDVSKVVAMLLTNPGSVADYIGNDLVKVPGVPTILLPTTAGTGSELTRNALFYVPERHTKEAVISPLIVATLAMIDPALMLSAPPLVTAASGMDALCHAVESYTGLNTNPLTEPYALESIRLIATHLREAVFAGTSLKAREGMALGSFYAGIALATSGTNGVHALAYPLQGLNRITHGIANSMLLSYAMEYNVPANLERFARIAQQMGEPVEGLSLRQAAGKSAQACQQLAEDVGIPRHLREVGIIPEQVPNLVAGALQVTRLLKQNPRPMRPEDIEAIFRRAL
jgi:alcohol dehydrogenase